MTQSCTLDANELKLHVRLAAPDLEAIRAALRVLPVMKPRLSVQALSALRIFLRAGAGQLFEATMVDLEIACEALASFAQKTTGARRDAIDETLARITGALLSPTSLVAGPAVGDSVLDPASALINRRPVVDRKVNVHAYEAATSGASFALICENLDNIAGNSTVLMNLPCDSVAATNYDLLPKERVILRLHDCGSGEQTMRSMAKLFGEGYRLAVCEGNENAHPVAGLAEIMTLDFQKLGQQGLAKRVQELRKFKAKLLVDKIDTYEEFELCRALGIEFFQGRFFLTPNSMARDISPSRMAVVQLMAALQEPDIRLHNLENIIGGDVALSYKLLRFTNSAYVGLRRPVDSISHAVGLVGVERIQNWASLLLFSTIESKPRELFTTAAIRAKMCEQLADSDDSRRKAMFFTVGLFSVLDAVLDLPVEKALARLPLSSEVRDALTNHAGPLGNMLNAVLAYERGDWEGAELADFDRPALRDSYLESLGWWRSISNGLML
jgi:EAL and modified HD-GYP domain-containing signal transduction protein